LYFQLIKYVLLLPDCIFIK